MTGNEMQYNGKLLFDASTSFSAPGFTDQEWSEWLTRGQNYLYQQILSSKNNKKQEGVEETEIRQQGLSGLIEVSLPGQTGISANQDGVYSENGQLWDLPSDFAISLSERVTTNIPNCRIKDKIVYSTIQVKPISSDEYNELYFNSFRKPFIKGGYDGLVWRLEYNRDNSGITDITQQTVKRNELITDGTFNITSYILRYIKIPNAIVCDTQVPINQRNCELDVITHQSIVELTVNMMMESIREQKVNNIIPIN